ncbi:MAG: copper homeostasis protein CutC [Dysgonamonadaceae bacterium]|jgi:copper homeostasis protein|nr:copper homeostasis protein CutC [Dysgonamonadaceae bacterium]
MQDNKLFLEVCADSVENALIAQSAGAQRIEFCASLPEGGTTPSPAQIKIAREQLKIKLYVLIRPRGGDFSYTGQEFEIMKSDICFCGEAGCDGVVIGMLNPDGTIDRKRNGELVEIARQHGMGVTFHRAFDRSCDLFQALEDIIDLGFERILTSGGYDTAMEGMEVIRQLIEKAAGRIIIMPGSGVTPDNAAELIRRTGLKELHGTFRSRKTGRMKYRNTKLSHQEDEYELLATDPEKIKAVLQSHKFSDSFASDGRK